MLCDTNILIDYLNGEPIFLPFFQEGNKSDALYLFQCNGYRAFGASIVRFEFIRIISTMSGHNRWKQIKERKAKTDSKKSQVFSKYAKLITNEARVAKGNKDAPALRAAILRARKENMPNENIERAIKKATEAGAREWERVRYEGYGPGGAALLIEVLTDNRNKVSAEIKHLFSEHGGNLASPGAASWAFTKQPTTDNSQPTTSHWQPTTTVPLSDADLEKLDKLVEALEGNEEVQEVFTNAE